MNFRGNNRQPAPGSSQRGGVFTGQQNTQPGGASGFQQGSIGSPYKFGTQQISGKIDELFEKSQKADSSLGDFGSATGGLQQQLYDPSKKGGVTKAAYFDALNIKGQQAAGVDQAATQATATAIKQQAGFQGSQASAVGQQMAQMGMSPEQIASQQAMLARDQATEQTQLLTDLASTRLERQNRAVNELAQMALSGRQMEQQEEQMALQDKWTSTSLILEEKGIDIETAYKEKALQMQQDGFSLSVIQTKLAQEFGQSGQMLNWAQLALQDEELKAKFNLSDAELELKAKELDVMIKSQEAKTFAQNIENFQKTLKFIDLTTADGVDQAKTLFKGMMNFSDPTAADAWWDSLDFGDLQDMEFEAKKDDAIVNAAEYISSIGADNFIDENGFSLFDADGNFKDESTTDNVLQAYYYAVNGQIPGEDKYDSVQDFVEAYKKDPKKFESVKGWADGAFDEYVLSTGQLAYKESVANLQHMYSQGHISEEQFDLAKKGMEAIAYMDLTGGVTFSKDADGNIIIKDAVTGEVLYDPYATQAIGMEEFTEMPNDLQTIKNTDGTFSIYDKDATLDDFGNPVSATGSTKYKQDDDGKWSAFAVDAAGVETELTGTDHKSAMKKFTWIAKNEGLMGYEGTSGKKDQIKDTDKKDEGKKDTGEIDYSTADTATIDSHISEFEDPYAPDPDTGEAKEFKKGEKPPKEMQTTIDYFRNNLSSISPSTWDKISENSTLHHFLKDVSPKYIMTTNGKKGKVSASRKKFTNAPSIGTVTVINGQLVRIDSAPAKFKKFSGAKSAGSDYGEQINYTVLAGPNKGKTKTLTTV